MRAKVDLIVTADAVDDANGGGLMLDQLASSSVLTISRSADIDHFRSIESLADARSIPLASGDFRACFATVALKSCTIFLQRTFPRILEARYRSTGAIVAFAMDDALSLVIDGADVRSPAVLLAKGDVVADVVERQSNLIAIVKFDEIGARGWPGEPGRVHQIPTRLADFTALRSVTRDILLLASNSADLLSQPHVMANVEESLLQAVDIALHRPSPLGDAGRLDLGDYRRLVHRLDEFLQLNAAKVLHSADLAGQFGVSVRTLNNAVVAIRGLSMHRYTRLRRLWNARQQLLQGAAPEMLKAIAQANGFWHMGEFRALYRDQFGETPQHTLERAHLR
ncbi:MAG: helix-turn-helix domain-containing protein [Bradyrhizobium sp.]|nr:helix-turn-helix domain-containing protein [Bradyrhizobium sp.]